MRNGRIDRVNELLRAELSEMLARSIKDPRLAGLVSVTAVDTATDLRHARVWISVYGSKAERESTLLALRSAAGFLRREISHRVDLRHIPEFDFALDDSIERGDRLLRLIRDANEPIVPTQPRRRRARSTAS
ncbi:MAG: 30S ribosome-binding factor RbfA [Chloroflexi bacterium]|nr:30S ribosome-binding factor RbfA [Chloroflexota bacterium]